MNTNPIIENILKRKSTRSFDSSKKISEEDLRIIAQCGNAAPSGMNRQEWHFTVVQNPEIMSELCSEIGRILGRPGYNFYGANAIIIAAGKKTSNFTVQDCSCALENMFLAATGLGIDSVWINQLKDCCGDASFLALLNKIGLSDEYAIVGSCALGYPSAGVSSEPTFKKDAVNFVL